MPAMIRRLSTALAFLLLLAGCGAVKPHAKVDMVREYGNAVRWSDWDTALNFVDPAKRLHQTMTEDDLNKLKDVKVTGYEVRTHAPQPDGTVDQTVEIRYIDEKTQIERSMRDHQHWRPDEDGEHWWLTTGLPEF